VKTIYIYDHPAPWAYMSLSILFLTQCVGHNINIQRYTIGLKRLNGAKPDQASWEAFDLSYQRLMKRHHCFKHKEYYAFVSRLLLEIWRFFVYAHTKVSSSFHSLES